MKCSISATLWEKGLIQSMYIAITLDIFVVFIIHIFLDLFATLLLFVNGIKKVVKTDEMVYARHVSKHD